MGRLCHGANGNATLGRFVRGGHARVWLEGLDASWGILRVRPFVNLPRRHRIGITAISSSSEPWREPPTWIGPKSVVYKRNAKLNHIEPSKPGVFETPLQQQIFDAFKVHLFSLFYAHVNFSHEVYGSGGSELAGSIKTVNHPALKRWFTGVVHP